MEALAAEFTDEMLRLCQTAPTRGYRPTYFHNMVLCLGGVGAAKALLRGKRAQSGLRRLAQIGMLGQSMEHTVLNPKYADLFTTEEKEVATDRLVALGFMPGNWE